MDNTPDDPKPRPDLPKGEQTAFDIWLDRGLHRLFDEVAQEPIPAELLKIIEGDQNK